MGYRCDPCELCGEQKGTRNDMNGHLVSEHVIFPNPRSNYVTFGYSEDKSKIQLKVPVLKYPTPANKLNKT